MMRSSAPKALVEPFGACCSGASMRSRPSAGRSFSRLATVSRSWPSSRPAGDRPSAPSAIAMVSPCCTRALGDLDAAVGRLQFAEALPARAWARNPSGPCSTAVMSASIGTAAAGCQYGARGRSELEHDLDHRIVAHRARDDAAVEVERASALNTFSRRRRDRPPAARARSRRCSGEVGRPCTWVCACRQLAVTNGGWPGSATVSGPTNLAGQHGRLPDLSRDQHVLGLDARAAAGSTSARRRRRRSALRCRTESRRWSATRRCRRARPAPRAPSSLRWCARRRPRRSTRARPQARPDDHDRTTSSSGQRRRRENRIWLGSCAL